MFNNQTGFPDKVIYTKEQLIAMKKLEQLQKKFDKEYIKEMFESMVDAGIEEKNLNLMYEYKGYVYLLRREPMPVIGRMPQVTGMGQFGNFDMSKLRGVPPK